MRSGLLALALSALAAPARADEESWADRFEDLARRYYASEADRPETVRQLSETLDRAFARARESAKAAHLLEDLLESQKRLFDADKSLQARLREAHAILFSWKLKQATGPGLLEELRRWCVQKKLEEERRKVQAILDRLRPPAKPAPDAPRRAQLREQRQTARRTVDQFIAQRAHAASNEIRKIVDWMRQEKYAPPEARTRLKDLVRRLLGPEGPGTADLAAAIDALEHSAETQGDARRFESRLEQLLKPLADRLLAAVDKCLAAREPGLGFDLFQYLIRVDPENARARKALGQVKVQDRWLRPYDAEQFRAGWVWDDRWGWILARERARYERGEYFDPEFRRWDAIASWNRLHAEASTPWRLKSEHFELVSTADLELSVKVLKRLEDFFLQAFGEYDVFFAKPGSTRGADLIFGVAPVSKRLVVHFYRDEAQFKRFASPPTNWAAGFYSGSTGASYFYADGGDFDATVLQHELTHQILGEFSEGGAPAWLAEGAAVYLEDAFFQDGVMTLGAFENHGRVVEYTKHVRAGRPEHSFRRMLEFVTGRDWDQGNIAQNYRGAGAAVYFLMTFDGGRYRGDFIDFLRDTYQRAGRPIEDYFGLSIESLDFLMDRFYRECTP
jgi:uncharacterized protein Yka (UPF0111/DUF47 family)